MADIAVDSRRPATLILLTAVVGRCSRPCSTVFTETYNTQHATAACNDPVTGSRRCSGMGRLSAFLLSACVETSNHVDLFA